MMFAIANEQDEAVRRQLAKGVTGNTRGEYIARGRGKITMFGFACECGNLSAAKLLYGPGVNIEARNEGKKTPLMSACASLNDRHDPDDEKLSAEERAKRETLVRWLVEIGADVNASNGGYTVLDDAVSGCSEEIVDLLIQRGARVDWPADDDQSAFMFAARAGNVGAMKALARAGANINWRCGTPWAKGLTTLGVLLLEKSKGFDKPEAIAYLRSIGASE